MINKYQIELDRIVKEYEKNQDYLWFKRELNKLGLDVSKAIKRYLINNEPALELELINEKIEVLLDRIDNEPVER